MKLKTCWAVSQRESEGRCPLQARHAPRISQPRRSHRTTKAAAVALLLLASATASEQTSAGMDDGLCLTQHNVGAAVGQFADVTLLDQTIQEAWNTDAVLQDDTAEAPPAGGRFVVADERGYLGTLDVLPEFWQVGPLCRNCSGWERAAIWEVAPRRSPEGAIVAVGPTKLDVPHARVVVEPSMLLNAGEADLTERAIDIDGDGRADLRRVRRRCAGDVEAVAHLIRSGSTWQTVELTVAGHMTPPATPTPVGFIRTEDSPHLILRADVGMLSVRLDRVSAAVSQDWLWAAIMQNESERSREDALLAVDPHCSEIRYDGTPLGGLMAGGGGFGSSASMMPPTVASRLIISGSGPRPKRGQLYQVVDERGMKGLLRATGESINTSCFDDCPAWWEGAHWQTSPRRPVAGSYALTIGPLDHPLPRARLVSIERHTSVARHPNGTPNYGVAYFVDLDGDGTADLRARDYLCGYEHQASETALREGGTWRVTERQVRYSLP